MQMKAPAEYTVHRKSKDLDNTKHAIFCLLERHTKWSKKLNNTLLSSLNWIVSYSWLVVATNLETFDWQQPSICLPYI